ncbi:MAG: hypothetical protein HY686_00805, partial [Chloroflexi bacterium]|nr:hypothetical protein [Chloroflexota bacterium]
EINLYRIAQEALSNVVRHAQAREVSLSLVRQNDHVILRVTDDGMGFDADAPELRRSAHLGLFTIRERARLAGGVAAIISQPGRGTTVEACIPVPQGKGQQI